MAEGTIMENQLEDEQNLKDRIVGTIQNIFLDDEYGFEVYVVMKNEPTLKKFHLSEGKIEDRNNPEKNFKRKIQIALEEAIQEKFLETEKEYDVAEHVADQQDKFYVITQNEDYKPFEITKMSLDYIEGYRANERENAQGILFRFERGRTVIWAYQFLYQNAIPNRKGSGFHIIPSEGDTFVELKKPILLLSRRIDLLIIGDEIVCDDIKYMQRNFGFQEFVKSTATRVVASIQDIELVSNMDKVFAYIERSRPLYAKKMMRIKDSRVLRKTATELYQKITTLPRWRGKFEIDEVNKKIILNTYEHVENLIDLLDERYTRSDVTDEEYDSGAGTKKWVEAVM